MTLVELLNIANKSYPDHYLSEYYNEEGNYTGDLGLSDTLAEFIVREITDTYEASLSSEDQLAVAAAILRVAIDELNDVIIALSWEAVNE